MAPSHRKCACQRCRKGRRSLVSWECGAPRPASHAATVGGRRACPLPRSPRHYVRNLHILCHCLMEDSILCFPKHQFVRESEFFSRSSRSRAAILKSVQVSSTVSCKLFYTSRPYILLHYQVGYLSLDTISGLPPKADRVFSLIGYIMIFISTLYL